MIFQRSALREFTQTATGVFVALFAILTTTQLIRLLGQAAGGKIASESVLALMGFSTLGFLPVALSLTLFISVLLPLSRAYRDSEMIIWFSSGVPLTAWLKPVLTFALPLVAAIAALSLFLTPWALTQSSNYIQRMDNRNDVSRISPGSFRESARADRVFFVETTAGDETRVKNIFISSLEQGKPGVMLAAQGHIETMANGDRFIVLENGRRYETVDNSAEYRMTEFERYAVRIESKEQRQITDKPKNLPLSDLINNPIPAHLGEILWRLGIPLAALNLALLAIPLAFVNPRAGRGNNLLFALLIYITYSNLLNLSQAMVVQEKIHFSTGVWAVHFMMFVILIMMFHRRIQTTSWWRKWL